MALADLTVFEYTTPNPYFVNSDDSIGEIAEVIMQKGVRHIPVMEDGEIVGVISHRDIGFRYYDSIDRELTAKDIMTPEPYIVDFNTPLESVAFNMSQRKIGSAIVQDCHGDLVGIFTSTDALNALIDVIRDDVELGDEL